MELKENIFFTFLIPPKGILLILRPISGNNAEPLHQKYHLPAVSQPVGEAVLDSRHRP